MITHFLTTGHTSHDFFPVNHKSYLSHFALAVGVIILGIIVSSSSFILTGYQLPFRMFTMIVGGSMAVYGLVLCLNNSTEDITYPIEDTVEEHHLYFDKTQKETLISIINVDGVPDCIKPSNSYNDVIRLDIFLSEDCKFATLQLSQYLNDTFLPLTDVHYYSDNEAKRISDLLYTYNKE